VRKPFQKEEAIPTWAASETTEKQISTVYWECTKALNVGTRIFYLIEYPLRDIKVLYKME
jgi:hypothetical protein